MLFRRAHLRALLDLLLLLLAGSPGASDSFELPDSWLDAHDGANLLFSVSGTPGRTSPGPPVGNVGPGVVSSTAPSIGNGFAATQAGSHVEYVAGLFNGPACPNSTACSGMIWPAPGESTPHRAMLPSTVLVSLDGAQQLAMALDMEGGAVVTLLRVPTSMGHPTTARIPSLQATQRIYSHQAMREVMVLELEIRNAGTSPATVTLTDWYTDTATNVCPKIPGFGTCNTTSDVFFTPHPSPATNATVMLGRVRMPDLPTHPGAAPVLQYVSTCRDIPPRTVYVPAGASTVIQIRSARAVGVSSDGLVPASCTKLSEARAQSGSALRLSHERAWRKLNRHGIRVAGNPALARIVNATMYSILSSLRADVEYSTSPGGLSTNVRNGFVRTPRFALHPYLPPLWPLLFGPDARS